jgi:3-oxoacyl-(acyl-carrier-protein) synthase
MTRIVITGAGIVLPGAGSIEELGGAVAAGRSAIARIERFDTTGHASGAAGVVEDAQLEVFPGRLRKRMDRFCTMSMVAAGRALDDAGLLGDDARVVEVDPERVGVYFANMFGGWEITEDSARRLHRIGYQGVSPYVASAWFPTAAQGQISIHWGLRGFAKTVIADTASGVLAVGYAADAIRQGRADVMLAGGAEAPVTPYTHTFASISGRLSPTGYRPFEPSADGFQVGEGGVVFVLESLERAGARGARILAEVAGASTGHVRSGDVYGVRGTQALARVAGDALDRAGSSPDEVDYVGLDAEGRPDADESERAALGVLLGGRADDVLARTVKPAIGHLLGAAATTEIAGGVEAVTAGASRTAVIHARGADGTVACCVLRAA